MSLDTLFTEAAEAGGPPRFTEDDIASRVSTRRTRRRRVVTAGAAAIVVAAVAAGALLAAREGTAGDDTPASPTTEIRAVAVSREALLGDWEILVPPEGVESVYDRTYLTFRADGRFAFHICNSGDGAWAVVEDVLVMGVEGSEERACGEQDAWSMRADAALDTGVPTLYEDGLLRIVAPDVTVDLKRSDDATAPDPAAARADADRPLPITDEALAGTWYVSSSPSSILTFGQDGELRLADCGAGTASWSTQDGALSVRDLVTEDADCSFGDRIRLDAAVLGSSTLTEQGLLVFQRSGGAVVLRRTAEDPAGSAAVLGGTRWVTTGEDLGDRASADWIEFDEAGRFRMSVACGTHEGTWVAEGSTATLTVSRRDLGPLCDPIALPADASSATIEGDQLRVDFVATAQRNLPQDLTTTYVNVDALDVPTADELTGAWSVSTFLSDGSFGSFQLVFDPDGTARVGSCRSPVAWTSTGEGIQVTAPDDECLADYGFQEATSDLGLRLDGDLLYFDPVTGTSITVLARVADPEPRPALVLHALRDDVGIEDWTDLTVDDPEQEAAAEIGHDSGDTITVRLAALAVAEPVDLSDAEVVLGGRTALVDGVLTFDCGGDRFLVSGPERRPVLDVGSWLVESLRCAAEPPA